MAIYRTSVGEARVGTAGGRRVRAVGDAAAPPMAWGSRELASTTCSRHNYSSGSAEPEPAPNTARYTVTDRLQLILYMPQLSITRMKSGPLPNRAIPVDGLVERGCARRLKCRGLAQKEALLPEVAPGTESSRMRSEVKTPDIRWWSDRLGREICLLRSREDDHTSPCEENSGHLVRGGGRGPDSQF